MTTDECSGRRPTVLVTQRVIAFPHRTEHGDYLDSRWFDVLRDCTVLTVPNRIEAAEALVENVSPDLVILSGGNNLPLAIAASEPLSKAHSERSDLAPARDAVEQFLIHHSQTTGTPVLGVCRGAQMLAAMHGAALRSTPEHGGSRHSVAVLRQERVWRAQVVPDDLWPSNFIVDSHHDWSLPHVEHFPVGLRPLAVAEDGSVEAFADPRYGHVGIMWHPEREPAESFPGRRLIDHLLRRKRLVHPSHIPNE